MSDSWIFEGLGFLRHERTQFLKARVFVVAAPMVLSCMGESTRFLDGKEARFEAWSAKLIPNSWNAPQNILFIFRVVLFFFTGLF